MGEKDMSEKILEDYNDVFSDIVNVLLFHGHFVAWSARSRQGTSCKSAAQQGRLPRQ